MQLFVVYVLAFGTAAVLCLASIPRARRIPDPDTRRGLVALLVASGGWASAHVGFLVVPTVELKHLFYQIGLILGIGAVGPWLYFCAAFTGRSIHRAPPFRRVAVGLFLGIVLVKVTNPFHQLYYTAELVTEPFPHLAVQHGLAHWVAMGIAYALATVGYFMLLELFWQIGHDTKPLVALVAVTGLPVVLDLAGLVSPWLLDLTYEPLGVAPFAAGVLFLYLDDLQTIQLTGTRDDPVIMLGDDGRVREANTGARDLFPALETGTVIDGVVPEIAAVRDTDEAVVEIDSVAGTRYYQLSTNPFSTDGNRLGQVLTLTDITERERYRTELERQNDRLERFASTVSHDLRNPLNVAKGRLDIEREQHDSEHLELVADALDRMEAIIEDVLALARQGQPLDDPEPVRLGTLAEQSWQLVETDGSELVVERDLTFLADPARLQQLLENLFRNSLDHGGTDLTITVGPLDDGASFFVADDGSGIPPEDQETVFESGYTTDQQGTGFGLAIVAEIAAAHGWDVAVTEGSEGGARFEITGVDSPERE